MRIAGSGYIGFGQQHRCPACGSRQTVTREVDGHYAVTCQICGVEHHRTFDGDLLLPQGDDR